MSKPHVTAGAAQASTPRGSLRRSWWLWALLVLVAVEGSLQVVGVGYRWWAVRAQASSVTDSEFTILCLGDSHTFGVGADPEHSYPRQLERLVAERWPERRVRIVNAGVPGFNSSQVLNRLEAHRRAVDPDLILFMVGLNDWGSFDEVSVATLDALAPPWTVRLKVRLDQGLSHLRLYRLAKFCILALRAWDGTQEAFAAPPADQPMPAGFRGQVRTELRAVLAAYPDFSASLIRQAGEVPEMSLLEELPGRAEALVERALSSPRDHAKLLMLLGRILSRHGRDTLAQQLYRRLADVLEREGDADDRLVLADLHLQLGRYEKSRRLWERLIEDDPSNPYHHFGLGTIAVHEGRLDEGIASGRRAVELDPAFARAYDLLGEAYRFQERWEDARDMFLRAIDLMPANAWFRRQLALIYSELDETALEREAWREAFRLEPDLTSRVGGTALLRLGLSFEEPADGERAVRALLDEMQLDAAEDQMSVKLRAWLDQHNIRSLPGQLLAVNVKRLVALARAQGIMVGLLTYPRAPGDSPLNSVLREVAADDPTLLFIDTAARFAMPPENQGAPLFSADGLHPNRRGYELLAREIMEALIGADATLGVRFWHGKHLPSRLFQTSTTRINFTVSG